MSNKAKKEVKPNNPRKPNNSPATYAGPDNPIIQGKGHPSRNTARTTKEKACKAILGYRYGLRDKIEYITQLNGVPSGCEDSSRQCEAVTGSRTNRPIFVCLFAASYIKRWEAIHQLYPEQFSSNLAETPWALQLAEQDGLIFRLDETKNLTSWYIHKASFYAHQNSTTFLDWDISLRLLRWPTRVELMTAWILGQFPGTRDDYLWELGLAPRKLTTKTPLYAIRARASNRNNQVSDLGL